MPFSFTCPHCGKATLVEDRYAGQSGPCGGCGQMVTMPGTPSPNAPAQAFSGAGGVYQQPIPSKGIGAGAIVLICVAVLVVSSKNIFVGLYPE